MSQISVKENSVVTYYNLGEKERIDGTIYNSPTYIKRVRGEILN